MGLLRTLLVILVVYYGLKIISRYILPIVLKSAVNKVQRDMEKKYTSKEESSKVGETTIDYTPRNNSKTANVGEYIDFEEVKKTKNT